MTVSERIMGAEAHWLMGRVMPREFLDGVGDYLHLVAPEREQHPELAEVPGRAVEHHPDAEAEHGDGRGRQDARADHAQIAHEALDSAGLPRPNDLDREHPEHEATADPGHRGDDVPEQEPVVETGCDRHRAPPRAGESRSSPNCIIVCPSGLARAGSGRR